MSDSLFNSTGTIQVTLPGQYRETDTSCVTKRRSEPPYAIYSIKRIGGYRVALLDGSITTIGEMSSRSFLAWYLRQARLFYCDMDSKHHVATRKTLRARLRRELDTYDVDLDMRWYLIDKLIALPRFGESGIRLFLEEAA